MNAIRTLAAHAFWLRAAELYRARGRLQAYRDALAEAHRVSHSSGPRHATVNEWLGMRGAR